MDWKKFGRKLLFPPIWVMAALTAISAVGLAAVFMNGLEESLPAILLYVVAFYTLTVICIYCSKVFPKRGARAKEKIYSTKLGSRYMTDRSFRTKVSLHISLTVNLLYVGMNLLSWYLYRSWWFVVLVVYYLVLSIMRYLLVRYVRSNEIGGNRLGELRTAVACSVVLLSLNIVLSGAVLMILFQDKGKEYHGIMIYVMALYTFYQTTHAIVDIIKYRKLGSPLMSTAKVVSLASALVSMLNLETAMFAQFGADFPIESQRLIIMLTGAGVAVAVVVMSVYGIVRASGEMKEIRSASNGT